MFSKILIANRGEIACRIVRTARRMGIATVTVYSDADRDAMHVAVADEAYRIGPPSARDSYLNVESIVAAAKRAGAEAIHPGYGFLSENAAFADACAAAGLVFIGPPASAIRAMGGKSEAKALMDKAGIPLVPGYHGVDQSPHILAEQAELIGYPVLIKASAGGGGRGMKVAAQASEFASQLASAKREAASSFGDDRVLIEKYLEHPRHVEIQVFADSHANCVYLFERDCSIQRRHQKVIEEAPAPNFSPDMRERMGRAAVEAARAIGYVGAGTIEFLYDAAAGQFYFMEMNTRLQVEHPVTEMITGLDLVEWQLRVAAGETLPLSQNDLTISGHAIEARLYAEDPGRGFLPQTGRLTHLAFPSGENVRVDTGVRAGDSISVYYDPMIAKLIAWGPDRDAAIHRFGVALAETRVGGLKTNIGFLARLANHAAFKAADLDTRFIERHNDDLLKRPLPASDAAFALAALGLLLARTEEAHRAARASSDPSSPWAHSNGWRLDDEARDELRLREVSVENAEEKKIDVVYRRGGGWRIALGNGSAFDAQGEIAADGELTGTIGDEKVSAVWKSAGNEITLFTKTESRRFAIVDRLQGADAAQVSGGSLVAPMPGRVISLLVEPGTHVEANQPVVVLEAMKMEHTLRAPSQGTVVAFRYAAGEQVDEGAELVDFRADGN
ncbi:MAG: acetyl/propionyl/methylcrotonyl-CoA carboxylase subunit alpha [Methylobacteriaceae bacterium]|nr:acetyl/propionyl/methylcrotonyl-CoA carboxylase subunit alpha [Methylobacteriaceae bacterium]